MIKITLEIDGMSCGMCESHVNETVRRTFSVKSVKSSHRKNQTEILSEEPLDEQEIRKAISATGYKVLGVKKEVIEKKGRFGRG